MCQPVCSLSAVRVLFFFALTVASTGESCGFEHCLPSVVIREHLAKERVQSVLLKDLEPSINTNKLK